MARGAFAFKKWYIDCLDREGRLVILYWASLEWRRLRLTWHSATTCAPGERARSRSSVVPCAPPVATARGVSWKSTRVACEADLESGVRSIPAQELAPGVSWTCVVPAARATMRLGDVVVRGTGYAELVELRTPPWSVGIEQLRWGRWISDDASRSVVWIAWNGGATGSYPEPLAVIPSEARDLQFARGRLREGSAGIGQWLFLDGRPALNSAVHDDAISVEGATLALDAPVAVADRGLKDTFRKVPALRAIAPRWLLGGHEVRRTRVGALREGGRETRGTAVDEIVEFG